MLLLFLINFQNQLRPLKTCLVILLRILLITHKPRHIFFMATIVRISLSLNVYIHMKRNFHPITRKRMWAWLCQYRVCIGDYGRLMKRAINKR